MYTPVCVVLQYCSVGVVLTQVWSMGINYNWKLSKLFRYITILWQMFAEVSRSTFRKASFAQHGLSWEKFKNWDVKNSIPVPIHLLSFHRYVAQLNATWRVSIARKTIVFVIYLSVSNLLHLSQHKTELQICSGCCKF